MKTKVKSSGALALLKHAAVGAVLGTAICTALLLLLSAVTASGTVGKELAQTLSLAAAVLGAAAAGFYAAGKQGGGVLVAGLTAGVMFFVVLTAMTLLVTQMNEGKANFLRMFLASIAGGAFGGVLKMGKKQQKSQLRNKKITNSNHGC